jgi:hypothetical protein
MRFGASGPTDRLLLAALGISHCGDRSLYLAIISAPFELVFGWSRRLVWGV